LTDVIGVRFRGHGKTYYFDPNGASPAEGQAVIVETAKGLEYGECVQPVHSVEDDSIIQPLRPLVRIATQEDKKTAEENREKERKAFDICQTKIEAHGLDMKLVDAEYSFEGSKILFFFTSDGRVDFRALVKDLAAVFRTRIELRQIGVRDGAKMMGGLGICGRPFCCTTFLEDFQPVSIKMAKVQSLSLNPAKISGTCGRLMCCLKYEQEAYEYLIRNTPKNETPVDSPSGKGVIVDVNLLRQTARVRLEDSTDTKLQTFPLSRLGYNIGGKYKEPEPEPEAEVPQTYIEETVRAKAPSDNGDNPTPEGEKRQSEGKKNGRRHSSRKRQRHNGRGADKPEDTQ